KNQPLTLNVGTQLSMPLRGSAEARLRLDYEHRGKRYWHPDNLNPMDTFGLLNARLALDSDRWSFVLWSRNLLDEEYWEDYNAAAPTGRSSKTASACEPHARVISYKERASLATTMVQRASPATIVDAAVDLPSGSRSRVTGQVGERRAQAGVVIGRADAGRHV